MFPAPPFRLQPASVMQIGERMRLLIRPAHIMNGARAYAFPAARSTISSRRGGVRDSWELIGITPTTSREFGIKRAKF
jgi:hypothetical protein